MTGEIGRLTEMSVPELYALRTACGYMLHTGVVSDATAEELRTLEAATRAEIDERPRGRH
jgi:hypothetical protein